MDVGSCAWMLCSEHEINFNQLLKNPAEHDL